LEEDKRSKVSNPVLRQHPQLVFAGLPRNKGRQHPLHWFDGDYARGDFARGDRRRHHEPGAARWVQALVEQLNPKGVAVVSAGQERNASVFFEPLFVHWVYFFGFRKRLQ